MSRAKTKEELRAAFLDRIRTTATYWAARGADLSAQERCEGVAFSILSLIDGCTADLPAIDLVLRPHPDDKAFCEREGDDWIEDGTIINNDVHLHDMFYRRREGSAT